MYVIVKQPHDDIPVYIIENQSDDSVKTVHRNMLLPLPTVLDWMRPLEPDVLVMPECNDGNEKPDAASDSESDSDSDSESDFPTHLNLRSQKAHVLNSDITADDASDVDNVENMSIQSDNGPLADDESDEIDQQQPVAKRKATRTRKMPRKYSDFIVGPMKSLCAMIDRQFVGKVTSACDTQTV